MSEVILNPYLYILVRTDMDSMGRGKGTAQACHAANQFMEDHYIRRILSNLTPDSDIEAWRESANGFGTTIVLAAKDLIQIRDAVHAARMLDSKASLVADPEYPLVDGLAFHLIPNVTTTAYIFGEKEKLFPVLKDFKLLLNDVVDRSIQYTES